MTQLESTQQCIQRSATSLASLAVLHVVWDESAHRGTTEFVPHVLNESVSESCSPVTPCSSVWDPALTIGLVQTSAPSSEGFFHPASESS